MSSWDGGSAGDRSGSIAPSAAGSPRHRSSSRAPTSARRSVHSGAWVARESLGIANVNGHHHVETGRPFNDGIETRVIDVDECPLASRAPRPMAFEELDALGAVADLPLKSLGRAGAQPVDHSPGTAPSRKPRPFEASIVASERLACRRITWSAAQRFTV